MSASVFCLMVASPACGELFADASLRGSIDYWLRDRTRAGFDPATGRDTPRQTNIRQASGHLGLNFESGWLDDRLGFDLGVYATWDNLSQGLPTHEMNFWHVDNPYDQRPRDASCLSSASPDCTHDGLALSRALFRFRPGEGMLVRGGLLQPEAPGALGLNRSFAPAYYRGMEISYQRADWTFGMLHADRYKAPWFATDYGFRRSNGQHAGNVTSVGVRFRPRSELTLDMAHAWLSDGPRKTSHIKLQYCGAANSLAATLYQVVDPDVYRSPAGMLALQSSFQYGAYGLQVESTYASARAKAANLVGNFTYRITQQYGSSAGNYDIWWNNRSDFNHDRELAVFGSLERNFGDMGWSGFRAGMSCAAGFARSPLAGVDDLREYACSVFAGQLFGASTWKNTSLSLRLTRYANKTRVPDWAPYSNLFQDELDLKLWFSLPFGG